MGVCREFGPRIHPDCEHPMRAGAESCSCAHCGTMCVGRFPACPQVWERSGVVLAVRAPVRQADPVFADPDLELLEASAPATYGTPAGGQPDHTQASQGDPWGRRRSRPAVLAIGTAGVVAALVLLASNVSRGGGRVELSAAHQTPSTTQAAVMPPAPAAVAPPAPTAPPQAPTTAAPPPPTTAAPAPAAAAPAPKPAARTASGQAPARAPARAASGAPVERFPRMCGFVPGGPVDVEINGRPAGTQTADSRGCVSRPPPSSR